MAVALPIPDPAPVTIAIFPSDAIVALPWMWRKQVEEPTPRKCGPNILRLGHPVPMHVDARGDSPCTVFHNNLHRICTENPEKACKTVQKSVQSTTHWGRRPIRFGGHCRACSSGCK